MSSRRTMVLVAAIAMGLIAAWVLRGYVKDKEIAANPNPVDVWVITADVKRGDAFTVAKAVIKRQTMPVKFRPATYVEDLKALEGKVASTNLAANQVLVKDMFVSSELASTGLRDRLGEGMVAIAVPIEGVKAVGGLLQPGDQVNIMVTPAPAAATESAAPAATAAPAGQPGIDPEVTPFSKGARYLYQQVRILSIGSSVRPQPGEAVAPTSAAAANTIATSGGSIVFEVPASVAQVLASIDPGSFYLTLIPKSWNLTPLPSMTPESLKDGAVLPGEDPAQLTPYGPKGYSTAGVSATGSADNAPGTTNAPTTTKAN